VTAPEVPPPLSDAAIARNSRILRRVIAKMAKRPEAEVRDLVREATKEEDAGK
jgi:hypothetical protein